LAGTQVPVIFNNTGLSNGNFTISSVPYLTLTGTIGGTGGLTKVGGGSIELDASETYTGNTVVTAGNLVVKQVGQLYAGTLPGTTSMTVNPGATLVLDNTGTNVSARAANVPITLKGGGLAYVGNNIPGVVSTDALGAV